MQGSFGSLTYDDEVIKKIVTLALGEITECLVLDRKLANKIMPATDEDNSRFLEVKTTDNVVNISADIIVAYGCDMALLHENATTRVNEKIEHMTQLQLGTMHLYVRDILPVTDFQTLCKDELKTGTVDNKTNVAEESFTMRINHFVRNIKERAVGMGDRLEGAGKGAKTKIKLFSKKGEGKTREFVTNLKTKKTNFNKMEQTQMEASAGIDQDNTLDFSAIDARNITDLVSSDAGTESQQLSQVTDDVFHKIDPNKEPPEKE